MDSDSPSRRKFIHRAALLAAAVGPFSPVAATAQNSASTTTANGMVSRRRLGKTAIEVAILWIGGYQLGSADSLVAAKDIVQHALDAGLNFFDNAWEYHNGQSEEWLGAALGDRRKEAVLMTKVCTHGRDKKVAMQMLEESLRRLRTDHLDVWQIHEVIYDNDPEMIFAPNGAAEALLQAKKEGNVRLIGFTGHKDPAIHLKMSSHGFPLDTVQMPLNPFDGAFRSFAQHVLPEARKQGLAVFGMKSLGGSGEMVRKGSVTVEEALRYAMTLPVAVTISGMDSLDVLKQNFEIAANFKPMTEVEMAELRKRCSVDAADGHLELFKTTVKYDGDLGRQQHGYPKVEELQA